MCRELLQKIWYFCLKGQDKFRGVDFYATVENGQQGVPDLEKGNRYQVASPLYDRYLKPFLKQQRHEYDAVIDVGCGKGRMLKEFSRFGFSKVAGLEYSPELAEIARKNMRTLNLPCEVFVGDAAEFDGYDYFNYFYLFNPFPQAVMERFVEKLRESISKNPRKIIIIYINPQCLDTFIKSGFSSSWEGTGRHKICVISNPMEDH